MKFFFNDYKKKNVHKLLFKAYFKMLKLKT